MSFTLKVLKKKNFWNNGKYWDRLKDGTENLSNPIIKISNLSISQGIFPNACKVSTLKPTFEKGKNLDPVN